MYMNKSCDLFKQLFIGPLESILKRIHPICKKRNISIQIQTIQATLLFDIYLLEDIGQVALATVLTVLVPSHEDTSTTGGVRALTTKTGDLARFVNLVELQDSEFDLFALVLDLLGSSVGLFLLLLTTTQQFSVQVKSVHVLNTIESEITINKVLASKRQELGVSRNAFALSDHVLDGTNRRGARDIKGKSVALERLDKDLHFQITRLLQSKNLQDNRVKVSQGCSE